MIAILLIIFTKIIINYLVKIKLITSLSIKYIIFGKWIIIISMLFFGITLLFNLGPAIKEKMENNYAWCSNFDISNYNYFYCFQLLY